MNGQRFPGWGFMRFWETSRSGSASHTFMTGTDGEGSGPSFPGTAKPESLRFPVRDTVLWLSATPRRAE